MAKFEKIYKYLQSENDEEIKYYDFLTDATYATLRRDDFLAVLVTARFSKMKELTDSVVKFAEFASVLESFTDQKILDKSATEAINGLSAVRQLKSGKEIACVFEFEDKNFPMVAYLDESYFRCEQDSFVGQAYLLCKVVQKVPRGQNIKLD